MKNRLLLILLIFILPASWCYAQNPTLWGVSSGGGTNKDGTIFKVNAAGKETVVYNFGDQVDDGTSPSGSLITAGNGLFYGLTLTGGAYGVGTIFSYDTSTGAETVLHDFDVADGELPDGSLIQTSNGVLYGTTFFGGANSDGVIFSYTITTGTEADLHDFGSGTDGSNPFSTLLQASNGLLYGLTHAGGAHAMGIIFTYTIITGIENDVHDFGSGTDGKGPLYGPLIQLNDSLLYGTTQQGGTFSEGTIFSYNITTEAETDLYNFGNGHDGEIVDASVIRASNGLLYGVTLAGGADSTGTIFSYNIATNTESVVHSFGSGTDGQTPYGSLIQSCNSLLYGMTGFGGKDSAGIIFSYNIATGTETDLHDFGSGTDGANPYGGLMLGVDSIPLLSVTPQSPSICRGTTITITVTGGLTYSWTPVTALNDSTGDSVIANPTVTTIYSVTGVGGCAPPVTDTVKVDVPALTILPQPPPSFCIGSSAELKISNEGSDFTWTPATGLSATTGDSALAGPILTTTYTVTGKDSLGCAASGTEKVTVFPAPIVPTFTQDGNTLKSSAQYQNQWYLNDTLLVGDTSQYLTITVGGEYKVSVTNEANGCSSASDSASINLAGINQVTVESGQVTVYPNPFASTVFIKINSSAVDVGDWNLLVTDVLGRTLYSIPSLNYSNEINLSDLPGGVYFITVITKTGRTVVPVVKE